MIFDRLYDPSNHELIYHYCYPETFVHIITSRAMWHTAYNVLNDSTEREWGYSVFAKATKQLQGEGADRFIERVESIVRAVNSYSLAMISCYSLDADVLSQWRAYADNGRGFAIGFLPSLMQMPAKKLRVLYEEEAQIGEMFGNLKHVFEYEKSIGFKFDDEFQAHWANVGLDLCAYKNPAFKEEKEIRFVHVSALTPEREIVPLGAIDSEGARLSNPVEVKFRIRDGVLVPYGRLLEPRKKCPNKGSHSWPEK
jgi:DUF2971 family protein